MKIKTAMNPVSLVAAGAWILTLGTLFVVVWFFVALTLDPTTACRTWSVGTGPDLTGAVGLTYDGRVGQLLAGAQIALVLAALTVSMNRRLILRRLGHLGLIAWAGLWLGNAVWFMTQTPMPITRLVAWILGMLFACTVLRAVFNWNGTHLPRQRALRTRYPTTFGA